MTTMTTQSSRQKRAALCAVLALGCLLAIALPSPSGVGGGTNAEAAASNQDRIFVAADSRHLEASSPPPTLALPSSRATGGTTTAITGVLFVFDAVGQCSQRELQRIQTLVGPNVLVSLVAQPDQQDAERQGPMHLSMDVLSGAAMLREVLRRLNPSVEGPAVATGCMYAAVDYRRANVFCTSPFPRMHAIMASTTQRRRRQGQVLFYVPAPVPADDAADVRLAFHRVEALYHRNTSAAALSELHATLFLSPTPSAAAQTPRQHRQQGSGRTSMWTAASSAFFGGDRHTLQLFLTELIADVDATVGGGGVSLEPLFSDRIALWARERPQGADVAMLPAFPCADELRRMTRRDNVTLHTACRRFLHATDDGAGEGGALAAPSIVVDTTAQCLGGYRRKLHDLSPPSAAVGPWKPLDAEQRKSHFPPPLLCAPTFLFGSAGDRNDGVLPLDLGNLRPTARVEKHDVAAAELAAWHSWQHDNDGGRWDVPHAMLLPTLGNLRRTVGRDRLLPAMPCGAATAASTNVTVVVTLAARYTPDRLASFVETFQTAHPPCCNCSHGLVVLVALVTDPAACEAAFLRDPRHRRGGHVDDLDSAAAGRNVVFLPVAPWKKRSGSFALKKCKLVVSRFPVLLLLLRVVQDEWHPMYAMITDARDVMFQSHVGAAIHTHLMATPTFTASVAWRRDKEDYEEVALTAPPQPPLPPSRHTYRTANDAADPPPHSAFAVVAERSFLGHIDVYRTVPYIFNRMWLANTFGNAFADRIVNDARLTIKEKVRGLGAGSNDTTKGSASQQQHRSSSRQQATTTTMPLPIICAGVMFGTTDAVIDAVRLLIATLSARSKCSGNDQGALIGLVAEGFRASRFPHRVLLVDPHVSAFTHGYDDGGRSVVLDRHSGRVLNCRGEAYAALHQMDRLEGALLGTLVSRLRGSTEG